ncbi:DUF2075 domain-containing protein [Candidatus Pacearchaeota archaeon]|nr:DUF2075 domain-containing protein [Candidatus Pacearchaeota archaeon]
MTQLNFNSDGSISIPDSVKKDIDIEERFVKNRIPALDIWDSADNLDDENEYNSGEDVSGFNLYSNNQKLNPLKFSNGKNQEDISNEIIREIKNGKKVIFVRGVCGTGKSAIALNVAKKIGNASIVVPGKALQRQYQADYSGSKYVLKNNHKKLKIKVITGRDNHPCLYSRGNSADYYELPCKIEIKEKNFVKLKEYLKENPKVSDNLELKDIRRISVASVCPYWCPILPSEFDLKIEAKKRKYKGLKGIDFTIFNRKQGCSYYNQFNSYIDAEVIVFNSAKYLLETAMNRKPMTEVEIIDECDEFLDSFSTEKHLNLTRLFNSLNNFFSEDDRVNSLVEVLSSITSKILSDIESKGFNNLEISKLADTSFCRLIKFILDNQEILEGIDEESYAYRTLEIAKSFEGLIDDAYVSFSREERGITVGIVTTNLAKMFSELLDKSNSIVMMSGTVHSERVLKHIFGIENFIVIDAEIKNQGSVESVATGVEIDCKYENFKSGNVSREDYLVALDKCISVSKKPALIHVNSFDDLPSEDEKIRYSLKNLVSKNSLIEKQKNDSLGKDVDRFKKGEFDVLFTTKCNRGVDFPGAQCRSIVFTKYPNPNAASLFWRILKKTHPQWYWEFYKDKAKREFLQKIYRGVRSENDNVEVLSPDKRVLDAVNECFASRKNDRKV